MTVTPQLGGLVVHPDEQSSQLLRDLIAAINAELEALAARLDQIEGEMTFATQATGFERFDGVGGTFIPAGTIVETAFAQYETMETGGIFVCLPPDTAPTGVDAGAGAIEAGTYTYKVTFTSFFGETTAGPASSGVTIAASHNIDLSTVPLSGTEIETRQIYRSNGGAYKLVGEIADNTTTTFTDSMTEASAPSIAPPSVSTAQAALVPIRAFTYSTNGNASPGTIDTLVTAIDGVTSVTNPDDVDGGVDMTIPVYDEILWTIRAPSIQVPDFDSSIPVDASGGGNLFVKVIATSGIAFQIENPGLPHGSEVLHLDVVNSSGGALGAITFGTEYKLTGAFTAPADGKRRTIMFYFDDLSTSWVELNRCTGDI